MTHPRKVNRNASFLATRAAENPGPAKRRGRRGKPAMGLWVLRLGNTGRSAPKKAPRRELRSCARRIDVYELFLSFSFPFFFWIIMFFLPYESIPPETGPLVRCSRPWLPRLARSPLLVPDASLRRLTTPSQVSVIHRWAAPAHGLSFSYLGFLSFLFSFFFFSFFFVS